MLKLKLNHTPRDVKVLTDQLVDRANAATPFMTAALGSADAASAQSNLGISTFAQSLLDDTSGSAALTTLGLSDFAKTVVAQPDAATAQTALGISSFAQTLLDDANSSTALTTLGVSDFVKSIVDEPDAESFRTAIGAAAASGGSVRAPKVTVYKDPNPTFHVIDPDTKWARVTACGGGGGGGGKSSTSSGTTLRWSQGGGGGQTVVAVLDRATLDLWISQNPIGGVSPKPANSIYVKPGTAGIGGSATAGTGGTGGPSFFHNVITPTGGIGGQRLNGTTGPNPPGGAGAGWASAVEDNLPGVYTYGGGYGGEGGASYNLAYGGSSHFGNGPIAPRVATTVGASGTSPGTGGSGVCNINTVTGTGGNGAPGIVIVEEYFS